MINALELYRQIRDEWDKTSQPLEERASVLPLGIYEDGSAGLAVPGIINHGLGGIQNFGRYGYDSPEAIRDNAGHAFDAAGLAMTGGLGTALAGGLADNALGSAGGRLAKGAAGRAAGAGFPMKGEREAAIDYFWDAIRREIDDPSGRTPNQFGLRSDDPGFEVGHKLLPSRHWDDGRPTDEILDGTSTIRVGPLGDWPSSKDDVARAFDQLAGWYRWGDDATAYLVGGRRGMHGDDPFEAVIKDAHVLAANAPTGAAIPFGMSGAQDDTDIEPALMQYLRLIGAD